MLTDGRKAISGDVDGFAAAFAAVRCDGFPQHAFGGEAAIDEIRCR